MRRAPQVLLAAALVSAGPATAAAEKARTIPTVHDAAADDALPDRHHITIPTVDISGAVNADDFKRHMVVAAGSEGKDWQHPHMLLMPDGKTVFAAWTHLHGGPCGPLKRSDDGGLTWSELLRVPDNWSSVRGCPTLHRLVVMFRNRRPVPKSEASAEKAGRPVFNGPATAWVGTYGDIIEGREGQYRVSLFPFHGGSMGYGKLVRLPDGTIVAVSYCRYRADEKESIVTTRFKLAELDSRLAQAATYTNPIVPGDWSDPGVIRVGKDYYSVCSTNQWQPGVPIVHSKDLVHWRYIGHAFRSNPHLRPGVTSGGVYGLEMGYNPHTRMFLIYAPMSNHELYVYHSPRRVPVARDRQAVPPVSSLLMACAACVQARAAEEPPNPNVAPQATVTAHSGNVVRPKYFAQCATDGLIPVENRGFADCGLKQGVWSVDPAKGGNQGSWRLARDPYLYLHLRSNASARP